MDRANVSARTSATAYAASAVVTAIVRSPNIVTMGGARPAVPRRCFVPATNNAAMRKDSRGLAPVPGRESSPEIRAAVASSAFRARPAATVVVGSVAMRARVTRVPVPATSPVSRVVAIATAVPNSARVACAPVARRGRCATKISRGAVAGAVPCNPGSSSASERYSAARNSSNAAFTSAGRSCCVQCPHPGKMIVSVRFGANALRLGST